MPYAIQWNTRTVAKIHHETAVYEPDEKGDSAINMRVGKK